MSAQLHRGTTSTQNQKYIPVVLPIQKELDHGKTT